MFLCHTVYGNESIQSRFRGKTVLVEGESKTCDLRDLATSCGFQNFITLVELKSLYPEIWPFSKEPEAQVKVDLMKRHGFDDEEKFKKQLVISGIFVFCLTKRVWDALQTFCDLLSTTDGRILGQKRSQGEKQFVELYFTSPDLVYPDSWPQPRMGAGAFTLALKSLFEATYKMPLEYNMLGKPGKDTFEHAEALMRKNNPSVKIGTRYIGDNNDSDIIGGKSQGMTTILVRTGMWDGKSKH